MEPKDEARKHILTDADEIIEHNCLLEISTDMFGYISCDGSFLAFNSAWEENLGFTKSELQSPEWHVFVHPKERQGTLTELEKVKTGKHHTATFESRFQCKDESYKWLRWRITKDPKKQGCYVVATDITPQKRLEAKLKESETRFQQLAAKRAQEGDLLHTLMENTPDHIYFKDLESRFIRINRSLAERFGLKNPAEAVNKTDFDFFTREHAQQAYQDEQDVIESGKPIEGIQEKETWPNEQDTWVSTTKVPIRDREGRINGTCGISRDITEYYRAQQAVRDSEANWRSLVESVPDLISTMTLDYRLEFINRLPPALGLTPQDIVGKSVFEFLTEEHHKGFREACARVIETGEVATYEVQGLISGYWYASCIGPIQQDGELVGFVMASTNITDRKQAEIELQHSEERFRRAVLSAPLPIMIHAEDGEVLQISRAWTELTGYTLEDIPTVSKWLEQANNQEAEKIKAHLAQLYSSTERVAEGEYEIFTKSGKKQIWEFSSSLLGELPGPSKRHLGISMALDITERIKTQKAMQQAKETAEYASRAKSDFLANMSHELRTPLNAIIGFAEILRDELVGSINDEQKECVNDIHISGEHLLEMINDILDLSKIEAGKMALQLETFSIVEAVEEVNAIITALAVKKDLDLTLNYNRNSMIEADRVKFKQVFYNLLSNAVKFTPEGGKVATELEITDTELSAQVIDTGIGIAEEDQAKLFAPFTQIDTSKSRRYGGTGLGLALTHRLIQLHGGEITVKSEEGKGSNFALKIPLQHLKDKVGNGSDKAA
ncbi:MAG: PAS domain S-box protein [Candidatus Poribacteria bacterium]|nr:PAS domain S-box protein [Candidatus Poribacteria bacterium]MDE0468241.1 PAS domain S-box protein [Candidatus Poribacteria bacterium]